jgi:hypothetical protein
VLFLRRLASVFDRLSEGATAGNAVVAGFCRVGSRQLRLKTVKTVETVERRREGAAANAVLPAKTIML